MDLERPFCGDCVLLDLKATSKKQVIQALAERIAGSRDCCLDGASGRGVTV